MFARITFASLTSALSQSGIVCFSTITFDRSRRCRRPHNVEIKMRIVSHHIPRHQGKAATSAVKCETPSAEKRPRCCTTNAEWLTARFAAEMTGMLILVASIWIACLPQAIAQVIVPGLNAPPVVPAPSPSIQIPPIPQLGVPPQPNPSPLLQDTFPDRVSACLQIGAAAGLSSGGLDAYTGQCVNQ
jgi:hypothetical protein